MLRTSIGAVLGIWVLWDPCSQHGPVGRALGIAGPPREGALSIPTHFAITHLINHPCIKQGALVALGDNQHLHWDHG